MKIKRQELIKALQAVSPGLSQKESGTEQSTCFVFKDGCAHAFNDEIYASHKCDVGIEGAIPAKEMLALLNKTTKEEIELVATENTLEIKGNGRTKLRLDPEIKLPIDQLELPEEDDWLDLPKDFAEAVKFCLFTCSKDATKPILTCIHVANDFVESSDNHRITRFEMKVAKKGYMKELLIPFNAAKNIVSLDLDGYSVGEGWLHFRTTNESIFSCRIFEDDFPDFDEFLEVEGEEIVFPKELNEVLDRAAVMSNGERVTIDIVGNALVVETRGDNGSHTEKLKIDYKGEDIEFEINPEFLKTILKSEGDVIVGEKMLLFKGKSFKHVAKLLSPKKKEK